MISFLWEYFFGNENGLNASLHSPLLGSDNHPERA